MKPQKVVFAIFILMAVLLTVTTALAQETTYTVQPGDTLSQIAQQFEVSVEQLSFANGITNPDLIYAGQELVIPDPETGTAPQTYTVESGDTLFFIARRFGTSVDAIVQLNEIADPDRIDVGDVLKITAGEGGPVIVVPPDDEEVRYVVQPGDTLSQIALRFDTTYQQIAALNGLTNPDLISAGSELLIRSTGVSVSTTAEPTEEATAEVTAEATEEVTPEATEAVTPEPTEEVTPEPTEEVTPEPTEEVTPEPTEEVTPEVTEEPVDDFPTPTPIVGSGVSDTQPNLLDNPGFEGAVRSVVLPEISVFEGWEPFYCDTPYTPEKCPALRQGNGNPDDLLMGRPEYKPTDIDNRVHSGNTAQQWFCFFRACRAGVYQVVDTVPGDICEAGAFVQTWSANGTGFTSDTTTQDERDNSTWFIKVNLSGDTFAFSDANLASRGFSFDDGHYDQYMEISYTFTANSTQTTVFFENLRLWPIVNNDSYIDDAYVRCETP